MSSKKCPNTGRNHAFKGTGPAARNPNDTTRIRTKRCKCGETKVTSRKPSAAYAAGGK